jgi:hypothetical protein
MNTDFWKSRPACSPKYHGIKVRGRNDPPLTPAELSANYDLIAQCSYEQYTAKPYWVPQYIDDVDICGNSGAAGAPLEPSATGA